MQKFVEGPVQISTKMNNYNRIIPTNAFSPSAFSGNCEDTRQMWGNLWTSSPMANTSGMDDITYQQSLDLYTKYQNRSLPLHSKFMTAAARNARNDFIITYATPVFQTAELNFHVTNTEWNQIEYDDLPEGGIANETTFVKWGWTDTSRKKKQELHYSVDLANDPIYGMNTHIEHFSQLASTCLLSLYKSTYYSIVHTAWQNKIYDRTNNIPFDISKVFLSEMEAFFAFAVDPDVGFNLIRDECRDHGGLDLVLLPEGGSRWVKEDGGTQRQLRSRQLTYNALSQSFEAPVDEPGPMTYKSYMLGENWLDFMETRSFQVNSLDKRLENPLSTKLTLCQFYPPNGDSKPDDKPKTTDPEMLDMWIFRQTKEEGEDARVAFTDMLRSCGYWDPETGEISEILKSYIQELNKKAATSHDAPWQFHAGGGRSHDVNKDIGDYDNPSAAALNAIGNNTDLTRMTSVRDKFVGVLYDTNDREYKEVPYVGSNHLDTLSNQWLMKVVESLTLKFHEKTGQHIITGLQKLFTLLGNLARGHVTEEYYQGLIDANMAAVLQNGVLKPSTENGIPEFVLNSYGSLRLPAEAVAVGSGIIYPNGFQSGPGLYTLRDEALKTAGQYRTAALEARDALEFVEYLIAFLKTYIGETDVINEDLAAPWFQFQRATAKKSKTAAVATFIDAIWERGVPVFLGVPKKLEYGVSTDGVLTKDLPGLNKAVTDELENLLRDNALTGIGVIEFDAVGYAVINEKIRALASISKSVADLYKKRILKYDDVIVEGLTEAMELYFKCVITQTQQGKGKATSDQVNLRTANAITEMFFRKLLSLPLEKSEKPIAPTQVAINAAQITGDSVADASKFIKEVTTTKTAASYTKTLMATAAYLQTDESLASILEDLEDEISRKIETAKVDRVKRKTRQEVSDKYTTDAQDAARKNVNYFLGDYKEPEPARYMRSPLVSSDVLLDFLRTTGFKWAIPGDETTMYTTPDENAAQWSRIVAEGQSRVDAHMRLSGAFSLLNTHYQGTSGLADGNLFNLGAGPAQSRAQAEERLQRMSNYTNATDATKTVLLQAQYPGPIEARMKFYESIEEPLQQIFFLALIQAKNKLQTHVKLAAINAQLINVLLFRPFIEFYACSIIVMKAGEESGAVPISRFDTYISKEDRGYFHIGCSYYSGFIRLNPGNFRMIPYCMPDRFVGGKKTDFMLDRDEWVPHNPNKPSIIALPTPVSERKYGSPVHMTNGATITRPDIDYPSWTTKYSSAGFYEHRYTQDITRYVDEQHHERIKYKNVTHASHVAHRGWRAFKDPSTGHLKEYDGTGPGCSRSMNMPGCQYVWNGKVALFAKDHETRYTRARAM